MVQDESSVAGLGSGVRVEGWGATVASEPAGWAVMVKSTVPCGGLLVPVSVSVTVTVQVGRASGRECAGQSASVMVSRAVTGMVSLSELAAWIEVAAGT